MRTQCPYCEKKYNVSASALDKQVRCINSDCGKSFKAFDLSAPQGRAVAVALEEPPENNKSFSIAPPPLPKDGAKKINDIQNLFAGYPAPGLSKKLLISIASVIVGFLILFLSFLLWAFGSRNIGAADIAGCYIDENDPNALLEFKENGRFCNSHAQIMDITGEWRFKDGKLFVTSLFGMSYVWEIKNNKIIDDEGVVWTKMKDMVISETTILGRYRDRNTGTTLDIYNNSRFMLVVGERGLPREGFTITGLWILNSSNLKLFGTNAGSAEFSSDSIDSIRPGDSPYMEGEIKGNIIRTKNGYWFVKESGLVAEARRDGQKEVPASQRGFGSIKKLLGQNKTIKDFTGKYIAEVKQNGVYKRESSILFFKEDGTVRDISYGREQEIAHWGIENGLVWFSDGNEKVKGKAGGDTITFDLKGSKSKEEGFRLIKQE